MKIKTKYLVIALLLIGAFLRFYNLTWGAPFYFHPDERNIADLVLKTSFADPGSLLTGTFAYGNFPVILTHLLQPYFLPFFKLMQIADPFAQAIIILRAISATFSVLMIPLIFVIGKYLHILCHPELVSGSKKIPDQVRNDSEKVGLLALFLVTFSTGFIQQSHFGTYDGFAAFCAITTFYFSIKFIETKKIKNYYLAVLFIALGSAAKINLLILAVFPAIILLSTLKKNKRAFSQAATHASLSILLLFGLTTLLSPNYLTPEFRNSLNYERNLVAGTTPVFYTQSFVNTKPIIFQLLNIYPFLINPLLTIIFIPAFFYVLIKGLSKRNYIYLLLVIFFLLLFLPQAFLHAKWTRYMIPTLPFIYLIISVATVNFCDHFKKVFGIWYLVFGIIVLPSLIFSLSYFITTFVKPDTRIEAAEYVRQNFPNNSRIITEPYDLGITPFNSLSSNIEHSNFYDLDQNPQIVGDELKRKIDQADFIVLPSQRLIRSRILNKDTFPIGHDFYSGLLSEDLGFEEVYQTQCEVFCRITYLGDPVFYFEETAFVFDRPTVFIYKKIRQ